MKNKWFLEIFFLLVGLLVFSSVMVLGSAPHRSGALDYTYKYENQIYRDNDSPASADHSITKTSGYDQVYVEGQTSEGLGGQTRNIWRFTGYGGSFQFMAHYGYPGAWSAEKHIYFYESWHGWVLQGSNSGSSALTITKSAYSLVHGCHVKWIGSDGDNYIYRMGVESHTHWYFLFFSAHGEACSFIEFIYAYVPFSTVCY
jgi:hypothetical protein